MQKSIFLAGWEVLLNGDEQCENFIATQATYKETVEFINNGLELVFDNDRLVRAYDYAAGRKTERPLQTDEIGLPYTAVEARHILQLIDNNNGLHQLGGEIPADFQLPANNCVVPFQYLGFINNQDKHFNWLPFKIHLTFPIYLNVKNVFLDYSIPNAPVIINRQEVEQADTSYKDDLNQHSEIVFNDERYSFVQESLFYGASGAGNSGIPNWVQQPNIPICPKSGNRMKFLCQLTGGTATKRTNVTAKEEWFRQYYERLNFWGDGNLFVFFDPTSNVACYFIQNT